MESPVGLTLQRGHPGQPSDLHPSHLTTAMTLCSIIRTVYLVFIPVSSTELLKPFEFPNDEREKGVFCYANEVAFLEFSI